jgi:hypothetical protein
MANPLPYEDKIYSRIKQEKLTVDPDIWDLIEHHVYNDLNYTNVFVGEYQFVPKWILKAGHWVIMTLCKLSRCQFPPSSDIIKLYEVTMQHNKNVVDFLRNLKSVTYIEKEKTP